MSRIIVESVRHPSASTDGVLLDSSGNILIPGNLEINGNSAFDGTSAFTGDVTLPSNTSIGSITSTNLSHLSGLASNVQTGLADGNLIPIHMERNGSMAAGQYGAFGNGAADGFISFPFNVTLQYATLTVTNAHTGSTTVVLNLDGTNQSATYQLNVNGATKTAIGNYTASPLSITAGTRINYACTASSGTLGTTVIAAFFAKA